MKKFTLSAWLVLKKSVINFFERDNFTHAASIAFSTIFSMPAILIIALAIGSAFYEKGAVQDELIRQIAVLIGKDGSKEIENILSQVALDSSGTFARVLGIITLIFSATGVFISLQSSLNGIWGLKQKPKKGLTLFIINRLLSMAMVFSIGFILLVSLVIDTVLVVFQGMLSRAMDGLTLNIIQIVNVIFFTSGIVVVFAMMFKVLPDAKIRWKDVWIGALVTTVLFTAGKYLIGFYLGSSSFNSAYGAAGSLVIILLWVYYSTIIFLFGAELTFVYTQQLGSGIKPIANAVKVKTVEVEK